MATTILEKVLPLWSGASPTAECPSCGTAMNVAVETCPNRDAGVATECRARGNTIGTETESSSIREGTEYETFRLEWSYQFDRTGSEVPVSSTES